MKNLQYEKKYYVHVYETGANGKLTLYSLFNYLQDAASDHAEKLGFGRNDLMQDNRFWVLSRMYAIIKEWPKWEDSIMVKTWPNGTENIFAIRNYEIYYPNGKSIGSCTSSWLILDSTTKKIQRAESILPKYNQFLHPDISPVRNALKINPADENGKISQNFKIRASDLDINLHTNNVRYLKWVYDTFDLEFLMKYDPQSAEINYLAESKFDDEIMIRTSAENQNIYNHSICRINDDKELCRIRLEWSKNQNHV